LITAFSKERGYKISEDQNFKPAADHPSIDLQVEGGMIDISNNAAATLRHRIFSNNELREYLIESINIHNPNYNVNTVPEAEHPYVLMRAKALAYKVMATDASRRRGLEGDADVFIKLAENLESQYDRDIRRQARIIPSPKIDESKVGTGDAIRGTLVRSSLRTGYTAPYRASLPPEPPRLLTPSDDDVEDTTARVRWLQDPDPTFLFYELWRDTQGSVERSLAGRLDHAGVATPSLPIQTQYDRPGTAVQVMGLTGNRSSPVFDGFFFGTAAEQASTGLVKPVFIDGVIMNNPGSGSLSVLGQPLEPESDYYYRLYAINRNGQVQQSNVLHVKTLPIRAKFLREANGALDPSAISPVSGTISGGTTVTIKGTNIIEGTHLLISGKKAAEVTRSLTELVVTTPGLTNESFVNKPLDLVLVSPTGLKDLIKSGFSYS
jgi:hypothetical protein